MSESKFTGSSRYATVEIAQYTRADGTPVSFLRRRFVPREQGAPIARHVVAEGDRPDTIAAATLSDPEQFWRLCDVNDSLHPRELTAEIGRVIIVAFPSGSDDV